MNKVTVTLRLLPEKNDEFIQTVFSLEEDMTDHKGFRKSTLCQDVNDKSAFNLVMEWETQDDLKRYLAAEKFRILLGAIKVLSQDAVISCTHFGSL